MIDVTDRHFRMLIRCISPLPVLYTEMTWDRAILYNTPGEPEHALNQNPPLPAEAIIGFSPEEQPLVMQLGGAEPANLARAAAICAARGYREINLNCGCPAQTRGRSRNCYGARLMFEPDRVAACCKAMIEAVGGTAEITVKCRLGVDKQDSFEELVHFVRTVSVAGVRHFIVHARKAILGLNTIQNRSVPPLRHEWVFRLLEEFPELRFTINGGIGGVGEVASLLEEHRLHGAMLGRRSNADPYLYASCGILYSGEAGVSRREVLDRYLAYAAAAQAANWEELPPERLLRSLLTPLTGLFHNTPCGPSWRRTLTALINAGTGRREKLASDGVHPVLIGPLVGGALHDASVPDALLDERPSLELPRLPMKRVDGWLAADKPVGKDKKNGDHVTSDDGRGADTASTASAGDVACDVGATTYAEAGIDVDGHGTAVAVAFDAIDGESCCGARRSGKGQEEMEAVLEAEARAADDRWRVYVGTALCATVAVGLALAARRR